MISETRAAEAPIAMTYAQRLRDLIDAIAPDPGLLDRAAETARLFDDDCDGYDLTNSARIYLSPPRLARMLAEHLTGPDMPVLDLACGTGLMGEALAKLGHRHLDGADLSPVMLQAARKKGIYRQLELADLHAPLPFAPGHYAAATCVGAFYEDLVHPRALAQILPLLRPGGWLACDIDRGAWAQGGFAEVFSRLEDAGLIDAPRIETGRLFVPGYLGPEGDDSHLEGRFVLVRRGT